MIIDEKHVLTGDAILTWDGMTSPEELEGGGLQHNLSVAVPVGSAEHAELVLTAQEHLNASKWKGTLPAGGNPALKGIDLTKFGEDAARLQGHEAIKGVTYNGPPPVYDANGAVMTPMQYGRMLYPGAVVKVIVTPRDYENKSKGIGWWLEGIQIVDATTPKLAVGSGLASSLVASAFSAGAGAGAPPPAPGAGAPAPHVGILHVMTAKANGATYDQFIAQGWTDEHLLAQGYMSV